MNLIKFILCAVTTALSVQYTCCSSGERVNIMYQEQLRQKALNLFAYVTTDLNTRQISILKNVLALSADCAYYEAQLRYQTVQLHEHTMSLVQAFDEYADINTQLDALSALKGQIEQNIAEYNRVYKLFEHHNNLADQENSAVLNAYLDAWEDDIYTEAENYCVSYQATIQSNISSARLILGQTSQLLGQQSAQYKAIEDTALSAHLDPSSGNIVGSWLWKLDKIYNLGLIGQERIFDAIDAINIAKNSTAYLFELSSTVTDIYVQALEEVLSQRVINA